MLPKEKIVVKQFIEIWSYRSRRVVLRFWYVTWNWSK